MLNAHTLDEAAEPMTLAAAETTLASPLAEVAAQPLPPPLTAAVIDAVPATAVEPAPAPAVVASTATTATAANPLGTLVPASGNATLPMLGALLLVVGLILVLGKLVKKVQARAAGTQTLQLKGGVALGGKERVVWMQAGETHLLLGVSPGRVQMLHVFDVAPDFTAVAARETAAVAEPAPASESPASREFSDRLKFLLAHAKARGLDIETAAAEAGTPVEAAAAPAARAATARPSAKPTFSFRA